MLVTLVHNANAGRATDVSALARVLRQDGHRVRVVDHERGRDPLSASCDVVVAIGGDGTLLELARWIAGQSLPLVPYVAGTANNIARSIGAPSTPQMLRDVLAHPREKPFDMGIIHDDAQTMSFIESAGVGWFGDALHRDVGEADKRDAPRKLRSRLRDYRPIHRRIELDGRDVSGSYIGIEIMNVSMMGPNLPIARDADPHDGLLDVVLTGPSHRIAVDAGLSGEAELPRLPLGHRASSIRMSVGAGEPLRFDGHVTTGDHPRTRDILIEVRRGALRIWLASRPSPARASSAFLRDRPPPGR
jgi:diacylglycerol kinase (ATP)